MNKASGNGKEADTERSDPEKLFDTLLEAADWKLTLKAACEIWAKLKPAKDGTG
jgi:hypothetical protein